MIVSLLINSLVYQNRELSYEEVVSIARKYDSRIEEYVELAKKDDIALLELDECNSMGYTLKTLGAALWILWHSKTFEDGLLAVVNEGGDADTNAAVACSVLGAKYGYSSIPAKYINGLVEKNKLFELANNFIDVINSSKFF